MKKYLHTEDHMSHSSEISKNKGLTVVGTST